MGYTIFIGNDASDIWNSAVSLQPVGGLGSTPLCVVCDLQLKAPVGAPISKVIRSSDQQIVIGCNADSFCTVNDVVTQLGGGCVLEETQIPEDISQTPPSCVDSSDKPISGAKKLDGDHPATR